MEWIWMSDRKPDKEFKRYIVLTDKGLIKIVEWKNVCDDAGKTLWSTWTNVVAWMELPEVPEEFKTIAKERAIAEIKQRVSNLMKDLQDIMDGIPNDRAKAWRHD